MNPESLTLRQRAAYCGAVVILSLKHGLSEQAIYWARRAASYAFEATAGDS